MVQQENYKKAFDEDKPTEWNLVYTNIQRKHIIDDATAQLEEIIKNGDYKDLRETLEFGERYAYCNGSLSSTFHYDKLIITNKGLEEKLAVKKRGVIFARHTIETRYIESKDYKEMVEKYHLSPQNLKELKDKMNTSFYRKTQST